VSDSSGGDLDATIDAYNQAIRINPEHADDVYFNWMRRSMP
jgi:hypothetical protein